MNEFKKAQNQKQYREAIEHFRSIKTHLEMMFNKVKQGSLEKAA